MKRIALVFALAVLLPSLLLAWLAIRSVRDQQFILERQQSLLYQAVADRIAEQAQQWLTAQQRVFATQVDTLLADGDSRRVVASFDDALRTNWPMAQVGFVVTMDGELRAPSPMARPEAALFCAENARFLGSREAAEVYINNANIYNTAPVIAQQSANVQTEDTYNRAQNSLWSKKRNVAPQQQALSSTIQSDGETEQLSKWAPAETDFRRLVGNQSEGTVARFVDDKLNVLLWYRPAKVSHYIFGAKLNLGQISSQLRGVVASLAEPLQSEICVAVLDDSAKPVALSRPGFTANWRRPFVATEIGEALPHWEISVYLLNPAKLTRTAQTLKLTFGLLIALLVAAIGVGGSLIVADLKRQLTLARQKTDFVSNVSHELKTPLTSIRMFSELLAEGRVSEPEKQRSYLNIITAEAGRLTRLINNVLDFSRMERGEKKYTFQRCDVVEIAREVIATLRPHFDKAGFQFHTELPTAPVCLDCDRDGVAQVLLNLLSNAEKYSGEIKEVLFQVVMDGATVEFRVCDRGLGVPRGCEQKIFEQFFRAHDSLASGIQGSGLGLTLCRQIARAHGGDVLFLRRDGGGSCFVLRLPVAGERKDRYEK